MPQMAKKSRSRCHPKLEPPFLYELVESLLFEDSSSAEALMLGRFRGTPVGNFDERWELQRVDAHIYRISRIEVNNARRCRAGREIWCMPKEFRPELIVQGSVATGLYDGRTCICPNVANLAVSPPDAITFLCENHIACKLVIRDAAFYTSGSCTDRLEIAKPGRILCIRGQATLEAPYYVSPF